jgi:hypothetical protein
MKLYQLKKQHEELVKSNNTMCAMISAELTAYAKMFTQIEDLSYLSEAGQCKVYQLKINCLEVKRQHTKDFLKAVNNESEEMIKIFDKFSEL